MDKEYLKKLIKETKNHLKNELNVKFRYEPTLEECDYLFSKGINVTNGHLVKFDSELTGIPYYLDFVQYAKED